MTLWFNLHGDFVVGLLLLASLLAAEAVLNAPASARRQVARSWRRNSDPLRARTRARRPEEAHTGLRRLA